MKSAIIGILLFTLGWVSAMLVSFTAGTIESPFSIDRAVERPSPYDWVKEDQIRVNSEGVILSIENPKIVRFANTNSMDPLLDENTNGIEIVPKSIADIHIGDVVSYKSGEDIIIHRVVFISADEEGWYCQMKGDNNSINDPEKVRFEQIQRVLVGIIY